MEDDVIDKRKHKRIYFAIEDGIEALVVRHNAPDRQIKTNIIDIAPGGMCLAYNRTSGNLNFTEGETMVLQEVKGLPALKLKNFIDISIIYILDFQIYKHIAIGCRFNNMPDETAAQLRKFIETWPVKIRLWTLR